MCQDVSGTCVRYQVPDTLFSLYTLEMKDYLVTMTLIILNSGLRGHYLISYNAADIPLRRCAGGRILSN